MLGRFPDRNLIPGMKLKGKEALAFFGVKSRSSGEGENKSVELNLESNGNQDLQAPTADVFDLDLDISYSDYGEIFLGDTETLLGEFDPIFQEENNILDGVLNVVNNGSSVPAFKYATVDNLNKIVESYEKRTGINPADKIGIKNRKIRKTDFIFGIKDGLNQDELLDSLNSFLISEDSVLTKIKNILSERDRLVAILNRNKEKSKELEEVNQIILSGNKESPTTSDKIFTEGFFKNNEAKAFADSVNGFSETLDNTLNTLEVLSGNPDKGSLFDHIIEDDSTNILGYGSGKRFVIDDIDIINASYTHSPPDFTRIDVVGDAPLKIGQAIQGFSDGKYYWSGATDFDMWRQYGYKPFRMEAPYLSDSELQCKPFALVTFF